MFWRNENTMDLAPPDSGRQVLERTLVEMPEPQAISIPEFMNAMLGDSLPRAMEKGGMRMAAHTDWLPQEVTWTAPIFKTSLVLRQQQRNIAGSVVAAGIGVWLETNGCISGEISVYYHRLVCTNGLIRKHQGSGRIEATSLDESLRQLDQALPQILRGVSSGFESLHRSYRVRLGMLRPLIPVVLDYMEVVDPYRSLIANAFALEPGDTLWHFVNAFSRAANLLMVEAGMPPAVAAQKRYELQHAGVRVCNSVLETFTEGRSLIDCAAGLRGILSE